jgi:hypothetical protein
VIFASPSTTSFNAETPTIAHRSTMVEPTIFDKQFDTLNTLVEVFQNLFCVLRHTLQPREDLPSHFYRIIRGESD